MNTVAAQRTAVNTTLTALVLDQTVASTAQETLVLQAGLTQFPDLNALNATVGAVLVTLGGISVGVQPHPHAMARS